MLRFYLLYKRAAENLSDEMVLTWTGEEQGPQGTLLCTEGDLGDGGCLNKRKTEGEELKL